MLATAPVYLHTSNSTDTFLPPRDSLPASKPGLLLSTTSKHTNYEAMRAYKREAIEEKRPVVIFLVVVLVVVVVDPNRKEELFPGDG